MSGQDALNDNGWNVRCACCGLEQHMPQQSRELALAAAVAQGWVKIHFVPFGTANVVGQGECCAGCIEKAGAR